MSRLAAIPELQVIRVPTLFAPPLATRRKGQGPKAKPADKIQEYGPHLQRRRRDGALVDFQDGTRVDLQDETLVDFQIGISRISRWNRSRRTTERHVDRELYVTGFAYIIDRGYDGTGIGFIFDSGFIDELGEAEVRHHERREEHSPGAAWRLWSRG